MDRYLKWKIKPEELRELYDSNKEFQVESFEEFVDRIREIKRLVDELQYLKAKERQE